MSDDIDLEEIGKRIWELDDEECRYGRTQTTIAARKYYSDKVIAWHRKEQAKISQREEGKNGARNQL